MNNKPRVVIGMPSYTGIQTETITCLWSLDVHDVQPLLAMPTRMIIDRARNNIAEMALKNNCDYVMFIDDDMTFEPQALDQLLARDKDIIAGLFFGRVEPSMHLLFEFKPDAVTGENQYDKIDIDRLLDAEAKGELIEVDATGTGFTLIKIDVFKKMREMYPERPFFATINHGKNFTSEDVYFCTFAKECGFNVFCDTAVKVGHIGIKNWRFDDFKVNAQKYKRQIADKRKLDAKNALKELEQNKNNLKKDVK